MESRVPVSPRDEMIERVRQKPIVDRVRLLVQGIRQSQQSGKGCPLKPNTINLALRGDCAPHDYNVIPFIRKPSDLLQVAQKMERALQGKAPWHESNCAMEGCGNMVQLTKPQIDWYIENEVPPPCYCPECLEKILNPIT